MIKGLYLALMDIDALSGYSEKLIGQMKAFQGAGVDLEIISLSAGPSVILIKTSGEGTIREVLTRFRPIPLNNRVQIYFNTIKYVLRRKPNVVYIRHFLTGPLFILFLICLKLASNKASIVCEIPTYPYDHIAEFNASLKARLLLFQDKLYRNFLRYFYNRIISIGHGGDIFGVKTISISNGIDVSQYKRSSPSAEKVFPLRIIGVGYLKDYHGYDRLIPAVKSSLLSTEAVRPIEFHIVSPETAALTKLKREVQAAGLSSNVIFHGRMVGSELDSLFDRCHLAVASLAWHRVQVERHSNLKTREYMARGVPFLYAGTDEQIPSDYKYACHVSLDETPIEMQQVLKFGDDVLRNENCAIEMRDFAERKMSWCVALAPVVDYLRVEHGS